MAVSGRRALRTALTEAAYAASRTKGTYVAAHHAQIRGLAKAIGATRHDTLLAYWHVVHDGVDYRELGPDWAHRRLTNEQRTRKLVHQLQALGQRGHCPGRVTPSPTSPTRGFTPQSASLR